MNTQYSVLMSIYYKEDPVYFDQSIKSMLDQTVKPDDFVIVKDGPLTSELDAVIEKYTSMYPGLFQIISLEKNEGLGAALALGIQKTKNELVARMDSDDISVPTRCEEELMVFERQPDLGVVGSYGAEFIDSLDNIIAIHKVPEYSGEIYAFMKRRCALIHPTVMYKKSMVLSIGNYHSIPLYEDYEFFARMILDNNVKSYNIQKPLYFIRISEDFYNRRGGIKYARNVLNFKYSMLKKGYMSFGDFVISGIGQACVCIMPNRVRKIIYNSFLRN